MKVMHGINMDKLCAYYSQVKQIRIVILLLGKNRPLPCSKPDLIFWEEKTNLFTD
jgi:hypothetical protein